MSLFCLSLNLRPPVTLHKPLSIPRSLPPLTVVEGVGLWDGGGTHISVFPSSQRVDITVTIIIIKRHCGTHTREPHRRW
jgi:hypothetical protein